VSLVRHQRRRHELDSLQGELRKLKPPSFDGEREREDGVFLGNDMNLSYSSIFESFLAKER
jgi:hypothetical protein